MALHFKGRNSDSLAEPPAASTTFRRAEQRGEKGSQTAVVQRIEEPLE